MFRVLQIVFLLRVGLIGFWAVRIVLEQIQAARSIATIRTRPAEIHMYVKRSI